MHWTWWDGIGLANPQDSNIDGYLNDWLMNGSYDGTIEGAVYSMFIGLSWLAGDIEGGIGFTLLDDAYYNGEINYSDLIVSSTVPAPGALVLFGIGALGLALARRRRQSQ